MYILESARKYSLKANHRDIGEQSTGLALYFNTIVHFAALMAVLFAVSGVYPLHEYYTKVNLDTEYQVVVYSPNNVSFATQMCDKAGAEGAPPNAIVSMSLGSRCNDPLTASYYSCPTTCVVTDYDTQPGDDLCELHLPCTLRSLDESESDRCCEERLKDELKDGSQDPGEGVFALQLVTLFLVMLWILNFHKQQLITAQQINARSVTVGDYTVAVSGLGVHNSSREDLASHMSHYGEVASVVYVKNIGTLLMTEHKLADAKAKLREIRAFREATASGEKPGMFAGAFNSAFCGGNGNDKHLAKLEEQVRELEAKVSELAKQKVTNVGEAFVTFNYEMHANNCFYDHRRGVIERILGWFGCVRAAPKFKGKQMTLDAPPEPCDVEWENYDIRGLARTSRNVKTLFGMLAALGVGIALQVSFEQLREDVRVEQYDEEVKAAAYDVESTLALKDEIYMRFLTMLSSFVIVAVNVFLTTVAKKLSRYQRFYTQSEFEAALMLKLTVVHVINSIIVPAASTSCERTENTAGECLWYAPGGLIEGAFYLQLFNAFLPNVIALADIGGRFKRRVLSRYAQTQEMMDLAMEPPEFILAEKYASVCKTVALAMVYGPVLPMSYILAIIALFIAYFSDKTLALKRCQKPVRQQNQATERVVTFMNIMALVQICFSGAMFFDGVHEEFYIIGIIFWILYQIAPVKRLWGIERDDEMEDGGTGGVSYWSNMGKEGGAVARQRPKIEEPAVGEVDEEDVARQSRLNHMKSRLLNVPESDLSVSRLDTYHPPIPVSSTDDTLNMIIDGYRLFDHVVKGDPKPLPGQKIQTAGPNRVCPPNERSARLEAPNMPTMQQEMTHFGNVVSNQVDAYANMMANPMQMMRRQQPPPLAQPMYPPPPTQQQPMQQQPMPPPPPAQPMYPSPPTQQQPMPPQPQPTAMQSMMHPMRSVNQMQAQMQARAEAAAKNPMSVLSRRS